MTLNDTPNGGALEMPNEKQEKVTRKFTILNKIGEGGYGNVYTVKKAGDCDKDSHHIYALKVDSKL